MCVHEKIIIQLSSLDKRVLQPADFYLQVSALPKSPPRIILKCLSRNLQYVEDLEIPELAYTSLFSMDWLHSINRERNGDGQANLEHCLLSADNEIYRVPWEDVVQPEFVSRPLNATQLTAGNRGQNDSGHGEQQEQVLLIDTSLGKSVKTEDQREVVKLHSASEQDSQESSGRGSAADESEGEYVELEDITYPRFSPQKGSLTQSVSTNYRNLHKPWTTGQALPQNTDICDTVKGAPCPQSMVCAMLIEENLNEPFHHQRQKNGDTDPASQKGTIQSDGLLEHAPENVCVPEHSDCNSKALNDLNTDIMHHKTGACEPDSIDQVLLDSDHATVNTLTPECNRDAQEFECYVQTVSKCTEPDTNVPNVQLSAAHESQNAIRNSHTHKEAMPGPEQEDPLDRHVSDLAELVPNGHWSESNISGTSSPVSSDPLANEVDMDISSKQPAVSPITARHSSQETIEPSDVFQDHENKAIDLEKEEKEHVIPKEQSRAELRKENDKVSEAEGVVTDAVEKGRTPQTGLVNRTPKSGTTVSVCSGREKRESLSASQESIEDPGILECSTTESQQVTAEVSYLETTEAAGPQSARITPDVPGDHGGVLPKRMDAALEGERSSPVPNTEEQMEEQRLRDEFTAVKLEAEMKSHQQGKSPDPKTPHPHPPIPAHFPNF